MLEKVVLIAAYAISLPCYVVYLRLIYVLVKHRKNFSNTFFQLITICGFADCIQYALSNIVHRFPRNVPLFNPVYGQLQTPSMLTCLPNALFYHLQLASLIGSFLLSINRYTSLSLMRKNEYVWRQAMPYLLCVMFFVPLIVIGNLFYSKCRYEPFYRYTTFTYGLVCEPIVNVLDYKMGNTLVGVVVVFPTLFFNVATFFRLAAQGSQAVQKNMEKHQWNFALICLSRFITDSTFVAYAFTSYLLTNSGTDSPLRNVNFYFYTINDILSVTPGIVLLVGSKKAREVVFGKKLLHFYSSNKSNSTLVVISYREHSPRTP